jgi:hypothetical protein
MAWVYSSDRQALADYLAQATALLPPRERADGGEPGELASPMVWDVAAPYGPGWVARDHPALPHGFEAVQPDFDAEGNPTPPP